MGFIPLSEREEYTFAEGTFDVRGWEVRTLADEEKVGEVHDMLIDDAGALRYLDVNLVHLDKHVLLPIGHARVDERQDLVWVPGMTKEQFDEIPAYPHDVGKMTDAYVDLLAAGYGGTYGGEGAGEHGERVRAGARAAGGPVVAEGRRAAAAGRLASLAELEGFDVADEEPDPRGWEVVASDLMVIGSVHELVVDTTAMKVRYLDCDVDEGALGLNVENRHILVPVGYARLDEPEERVIVDAISSSDVRSLPSFGGLPVTRRYEEEVRGRFNEELRGGNGRENGRTEAERFYAPRRGGGGVEATERSG